MKQPNNLTFIPTEALLNEVFNRVDCGIFCSVRAEDKNYTRTNFKGDFVTCIGLSEIAKSMVLKEYKKWNRQQ